MFERYSEGARRAIFLARYEAWQHGSELIEPEHLLLGLLREDRNPDHRGWIEAVRDEVDSQIFVGDPLPMEKEVPLSKTCKTVLKLGVEEAHRLGHREIGPEHLLVGILLGENCPAAKALNGHGMNLVVLREEAARNKPIT